jgi:hypothetical protein
VGAQCNAHQGTRGRGATDQKAVETVLHEAKNMSLRVMSGNELVCIAATQEGVLLVVRHTSRQRPSGFRVTLMLGSLARNHGKVGGDDARTNGGAVCLKHNKDV